MEIPSTAAIWFLPFVLPVCLYVAFTDLREMKIKNQANTALCGIFIVVGLIALPMWSGDWPTGTVGPFTFSLPIYVWQLLHLPVVLLIGFLLNAGGAVGAGDAKFAAVAAPFVWTSDIRLVLAILAAGLLGAFFTHRLAKYTALRRIAPEWKSWEAGKLFPMGLTLAGSLSIYLILGTIYGA